MADAVTQKTIDDFRKDAVSAGEFVGTEKVVVPRYGNPFKSAPMISQEVLDNGGYRGFENETKLKAYRPTILNSLAKDLETRKIWCWQTRAPDLEPKWHDTGRSDLDLANENSQKKQISNFDADTPVPLIKRNRGVQGTLNGGDAGIVETPNGICYEFEVDPNTTYFVLKKQSTRFRIAEFPRTPAGGAGNITFIGGERTIPNPEIIEEHLFTTSSSAKSLIAYTTNTEEEVGLVFLKTDQKGFKTAVDIKTPSSVESKNICQNVILNNRYFTGIGDVEVLNSGDTNIQFIVQPVKPNTTYTISKKGGNRFRVALSNNYPVLASKVRSIYIQDDVRYMPQAYTFTTSSTDTYLSLMLSNDPKDQAFEIQIEEGLNASKYMMKGVFDKTLDLPFPVGDAHYFDAMQWYKDEALKIPAADDTFELQRLINIGGYVTLDPTRVYYITGTVTIDLRKVKYFNGMNALIVVKGDIDGILIKGGHNSISHPTNVGRNAYWDKDGIVTGLRCVPAVKGQGNGIIIEQCIGLRLFGNASSLFRKGLSLRKYTRDLIIFGNQIWSNDECNLYMDSTCNIHQSLIFGNIMTYAKYCIWYDGCEIYNQSVTNNILETAENPIFDSENIRIPEAIIYMDANGKTLGGINIECNGIEDHAVSNRNIKMIASNGGQLLNVTVNGGLATSSKGSEIEFGALDENSVASGITLSGFTSNSTAGSALIKQIGHVGKVKVNGINYTGARLYECDGDFLIGQLTINDCESSVGSSFSNILINARSANVIKVQDNTLAVSGSVTTTNVVDINLAESSRIVAVKGNVFVASDSVPSDKKLVNVRGVIKKTAITDNVSDLDEAQYLSETTGVSIIRDND